MTESKRRMRFDVVTLFPEMIMETSAYGVTGRAFERGIATIDCWNPRDFTNDKHASVDDRPYGGGPGMVMKVAPLRDAIRAARQASPLPVRVALLTPQGKPLSQANMIEFSSRRRMLLVAGRYEGVDERLIEGEIDEEWSLGDYIISGGELAALNIIDAVTRLLPGVLGDDESAQQESHMNGLLDFPHYTRPETVDGRKVPAVLSSGNHDKIAQWRLKQALGRTWQRRSDLLENCDLDARQLNLLKEYQHEIEIKGKSND